MSAILSLVGHIQLTKAPPQEQLETISSSTLVWGTFLLSFKGGAYKSKRKSAKGNKTWTNSDIDLGIDLAYK